MLYDDATSDTIGVVPAHVSAERAATHIGLFLRYCFQRGWASALHKGRGGFVEDVIIGKMTGTEFLLRFCDGALTDREFNVDGNAFVSWYYKKFYPRDYLLLYESKRFVRSEGEHNLAELEQLLQTRIESYVNMGSQTAQACGFVLTMWIPIWYMAKSYSTEEAAMILGWGCWVSWLAIGIAVFISGAIGAFCGYLVMLPFRRKFEETTSMQF